MSDVVERAKAALEGVTYGPWEYDYSAGSMTVLGGPVIWLGDGDLGFRVEPHHQADENAAFVTDARWLIPELVAEVERLRAEKRGLEISESDLLVQLRAENERLRAAIEPIRQLHQRVTVEATSCPEGCEVHEDECPNDVDFPVCRGCYDAAEEIDAYFPEFNIRAVEWPCETAKLIYTTEELNR